jgi:hypothetical protein
MELGKIILKLLSWTALGLVFICIFEDVLLCNVLSSILDSVCFFGALFVYKKQDIL